MMSSSLILYFCLCIFRILNTLLIQTQFDPDEYWQNLEPAYCEVFHRDQPCQGYTWEWLRRAKPLNSKKVLTAWSLLTQFLQGPVRSYTSILPTYAFYRILQAFQFDSTWMVARGPLIIHAILVAAPTDWAVWSIAHWMQRPDDGTRIASLPWFCLFCSVTSWFNAYALVRTYSNAMETLLLALAIALVSPDLLGSRDGSSKTLRISTWLAFILGGISSSIRISSLAAWVPMGILLAFQQRKRSSILSVIGFVLFPCAFFGLVGIAATIAIDRYFYGFWAAPFLGNFHFNVLLRNDSLYGTHPFSWYVWGGIPAIAGLLLPFLLLDVRYIWGSRSHRNLWIIALCYIFAHSMSPHKEFRFLLPLMPIFCNLAGTQVQIFCETRSKPLRWLKVGAAANLIAILYLGLFHQRAPVDVNATIVEMAQHKRKPYTIHYLMGCHSTPLLSHLHSPPTKFDTWTLDCSPSCRSNPKEKCESDRFAMDPAKFMEDTYFRCIDVEMGTCVSDYRLLYPDFLVAYAGDIPSMKSSISTMGMKEVARFHHGINGIGLSNGMFLAGKDAFMSGAYRKVSFLNLFEISLDEMVLFASHHV